MVWMKGSTGDPRADNYDVSEYEVVSSLVPEVNDFFDELIANASMSKCPTSDERAFLFGYMEVTRKGTTAATRKLTEEMHAFLEYIDDWIPVDRTRARAVRRAAAPSPQPQRGRARDRCAPVPAPICSEEPCATRWPLRGRPGRGGVQGSQASSEPL